MKRLGVKAKVMIGGAAYLGMKGLGTYLTWNKGSRAEHERMKEKATAGAYRLPTRGWEGEWD